MGPGGVESYARALHHDAQLDRAMIASGHSRKAVDVIGVQSNATAFKLLVSAERDVHTRSDLGSQHVSISPDQLESFRQKSAVTSVAVALGRHPLIVLQSKEETNRPATNFRANRS